MSFNPFLDYQGYSICNALNWGMCRQHYKIVQTDQYWVNRAVHLSFALTQNLPLIGQIASIFELCTLGLWVYLKGPKFHHEIGKKSENIPYRPSKKFEVRKLEPFTSCKPSTERFVENQLYWPTDLTLLGINESQRKVLSEALKIAQGVCNTVEFGVKSLTYKTPGPSKVNTVSLPIHVEVAHVNAKAQYILFPKSVFKDSGERKIRWAYNVSKGEFLLKKRIVGALEVKLVLIPFPILKHIPLKLIIPTLSLITF
jgi:hypothetical protein